VHDTIGPYRVIRRLGAGGMGEVFLAEDPRLGRQVAIKRPTDAWLATPTARERLRREARAAARLSHPNIAAIFDVLDDHERPHIVMEYVEGETLGAIMAGGPLSAARVTDIGLQLADALIDAHAHGVIHRDLKLGNVMLTPAGRVKVLDFGLATSVATSPEAGTDERITDTGRVLGTPGYMAPEQMLGYRGDERSDIYSVGVMLFGLLAGRLPFDGPDSGGRLLTMLSEAQPPRADAANPAVPAPAADVIARAMARDPEARFQSASELHEALARLKKVLAELPTGPSEVPTGEGDARRPGRRALLVLALIVVAGLGAFWSARWWRTPPPRRPVDMPVVAVLPFEVISSDAANAYLGVGFADSLITELAQLPDVTVVRREELRDFIGARRDPKLAAAAVGANVVVDASLQVQEHTLRVNVTLYRTDGTRLDRMAGSSREGSTDRLFDLQHQLAAGVIDGAKLGALSPATETVGTTNPIAQTKYWQGRALLDRADLPGNIEQAMTAFQAALTLDATFARARAALGEAAWLRYKDTKDPQWVTQALAETQAAVRQDPTMADAYVSLAIVYQGTGKPADAIAALRKAIALQPSHDNAHEVLGDALFANNQKTEALAQFREAIRLRPRAAHHYSRLAVADLRLGRYDDAIATLKTAVDLQPDNAETYHLLGTAYQFQGDAPDAVANYERAIALKPVTQTYANLGVIQYDQGDYAKAAQAFEHAVALKPNEPAIHRNLADAYGRLGDAARARSQYLIAVDQLQQSLKINPKDSHAMGLLAVCFAKVGRLDTALDDAKAAVGLSPTDGEVLYRRAVVLAIAGQTAGALAALDDALSNGYSAKSAAKDDDLQGLARTAAFQALIAKHRQ
jgi:tetratricopeptide (TPR) repeat protein